MADLEKVNQAQLQNALQTTIEPSRKRLCDEEYSSLLVLFKQMQDRYPSQDLEGATEGYLMDYEQLALKYSLPKVQAALAELRLKPGRAFFPRPDEVAEEIEVQRERKMIPTTSDAQRYLEDLERWKQEHAEYKRELESK